MRRIAADDDDDELHTDFLGWLRVFAFWRVFFFVRGCSPDSVRLAGVRREVRVVSLEERYSLDTILKEERRSDVARRDAGLCTFS